MPTGRSGPEMVQIDVEEGVDLHAVRAHMHQPYVKSPRVIQRGEERVRDVDPLSIARHVHHVEKSVFATLGRSYGCDVGPLRRSVFATKLAVTGSPSQSHYVTAELLPPVVTPERSSQHGRRNSRLAVGAERSDLVAVVPAVEQVSVLLDIEPLLNRQYAAGPEQGPHGAVIARQGFGEQGSESFSHRQFSRV
jgi:hypothetical protein